MSEIYMKKKAFWNDKSDHEKNKKIISIFIGLVILLIFSLIIISNRENVLKQIKEIKDYEYFKSKNINPYSVYSEKKKLRIKCLILLKSKTCENYLNKKLQNYYVTSIRKYFHNNNPLIHKFNPILQSSAQDEDYYMQKFNRAYRHLLFVQCISKIYSDYDEDLRNISREVELFYNFLLNRPKWEFEITNDYLSEINYYNNHMCFISGTAHLALRTNSMPRCIEFKNFQMNNFYVLNRRESNIYFKFHVFKKNKNNKIHIYPSSKQMINYNLIKQYADISDYFENKNVLIYLDHNTGDKMIRICNVLSSVDPAYYDNNFWLEVVWNPEIQNLLCLENINYIN